MIVLSYRGRTLEVSAQVIKTFQDMEITRQATVKEKAGAAIGDVKQGFADVSSLKADSVSFEMMLQRSANVDVGQEVKAWRALVDGAADRIYFAGTDLLEMDMKLTGCDATEIQISADGEIAQAKLKLTFMRGEMSVKESGKGKSFRDSLSKQGKAAYDALGTYIKKTGAWDSTAGATGLASVNSKGEQFNLYAFSDKKTKEVRTSAAKGSSEFKSVYTPKR